MARKDNAYYINTTDSNYPPNNEVVTDNGSKATLFNSYFCEQSTVDDTNASLPPANRPTSKLDNITISETDVLDALSNINTSKASGPDLISPRILKEAAKGLSLPLSDLYFPSDWKLANVIPVFKTITQEIVHRTMHRHIGFILPK